MAWNLTTEPSDAAALLREQGVCLLSPAALRQFISPLDDLSRSAKVF